MHVFGWVVAIPPHVTVSVSEFGDTTKFDAASRLRTSFPYTLFDTKFIYDKSPLFWDEQITDGGGSPTSVHVPNSTVTYEKSRTGYITSASVETGIMVGYVSEDFGQIVLPVHGLLLGSTIAGVSDELVIAVHAHNNNGNYVASITYRDLL